MIAVIGTGLTGLVQALALAAKEFPVTLIGTPPSTKQDDRTTAILAPGIDFLKSLGLWDELKTSSVPLMTMELIDGKQHSIFDSAEINQDVFGYNISNDALKNALVKRLTKNKLVAWHQENAAALQQNDNGWHIILTSKKKITCDLLIGADGRDSMTRKAANISTDEKNVDQIALVSILKPSKSHFNTTVEWYLSGGPLTLVPLRDNKLAMVWCDTSDIQNKKLTAPKASIEKQLTALSGNRFGTLSLAAPLQSWKVRPMKAERLVAQNCALVGEAAHVLPPIGAQGFNISLHDIIALTRLLEQSREIGYTLNDATLLAQYEAIRGGEISLRYKSVNTLNASLLNNNAAARMLRRASLFGMQRLSFIKKYVMQMGLKQAA